MSVLIFLLALISVAKCTRDHTAVDCFSHEVLHGSSNTTIADRDSLDISFRTNDYPILLFKSSSDSTLFKVSFGNCEDIYCVTFTQYGDQEYDTIISFSEQPFRKSYYKRINVSWKGDRIMVGFPSFIARVSDKKFLETPAILEIICSNETLTVKENECSQRGENIYNWRVIYHQYETIGTKVHVTDDPLNVFFRNITNMEEFKLGSSPFTFVMQWDTVPLWQMWSQKSDPTSKRIVTGYSDIDVNYREEWHGLSYESSVGLYPSEMYSGFGYTVGARFENHDLGVSFPGPFRNSILEFVNEVFLHVRVYPLCELQRRNNHWNNIHKNCKADGKYESEPCKVCGVGEYEEKTCGETENTVCKTCKICSLGSEYAIFPCISTSDALCTECSEMCEENQYIKQNCTQENDIICETCTTTCDSDQYIKEKCTGTKDALCAKCNPCPSNFYPSGGCNGTHDTLCTSCSPECSEGFYELQECNATHPRICSQCTECQHPMSFISTNCSKHSDTVCSSFENNHSRSKKKQQEPYNFILIIIICGGIVIVLSIVIIAGYVYRLRRKRILDESDCYVDSKTCSMNSCHTLISLPGKGSIYNGSVDEIQNDSGLYSSLYVQKPEFLSKNGDADISHNKEPIYEEQRNIYSSPNVNVDTSSVLYSECTITSQNRSGEPAYEAQGSEYSALNINAIIPEEQEYSGLQADDNVIGEYSALGREKVATHSECTITSQNRSGEPAYEAQGSEYSALNINSIIPEEQEYSGLQANDSVIGEYSALGREKVATHDYLAFNVGIVANPFSVASPLDTPNAVSGEYSALTANSIAEDEYSSLDCVGESNYSVRNEKNSDGDEYSVVSAKSVAEGTYTMIEEKKDQESNSALDKEVYLDSSSKNNTNYAF